MIEITYSALIIVSLLAFIVGLIIGVSLTRPRM